MEKLQSTITENEEKHSQRIEEMKKQLLNKIRQFAKRQDIFFRKLEREGHNIHWLAAGQEPDPEKLIADFLDGKKIAEPEFRLCDHKNPPSYKKTGA